MNTPIVDFVRKYSQSDISRLHMPGHKGVEFIGCENFDITEINGADALYAADGIIAESEMNATELFGSLHTFYSAGGSSQCIKAMLALAKGSKKDFTVLAARNVHKSFVYGCALLNIRVNWLTDSENFSLCRCNVTPDVLEAELIKQKADAVYITSPDYLGNMNDIRALTDVAHKFGALMLVDNAHGAYLHFLSEIRHPVDCGADMCCDSAHKTLPVLTGGAYLHINNSKFIASARGALEMFGSTSPSYLILQSLDMCNSYLSCLYREKLARCAERVAGLRITLNENGWEIINSDPLKLTICSHGVNLSEILRKNGFECEYEDPDYTVMMFTPETPDYVYDKLSEVLGVNNNANIPPQLSFTLPEKSMEIRDALFSDSESVDVENAVGRIVADTTVGCPPAVPVLVSGEVVTENSVKIMKHYGINTIKVISG